MCAKPKRDLGVDKRAWHPSPLAGQITLVTTLNDDGTSNVAPKSWISMMAFNPPLLALGCNRQHWTARNILRDREFVVNVPGADLAEVAWHASSLPHPRPVEALGLTPIRSSCVKPPRIEECRAHLECALDQSLAYGDEIILLGHILAVSVDEEVLTAGDPYAQLRLFAFLEDGMYGVIERARRLSG